GITGASWVRRWGTTQSTGRSSGCWRVASCGRSWTASSRSRRRERRSSAWTKGSSWGRSWCRCATEESMGSAQHCPEGHPLHKLRFARCVSAQRWAEPRLQQPGNRRMLDAMHELGLVPGRPYKKSATVVGDVLGKYHPHGDIAVYDALVRMVQDFSLRYPLVDGQGNFGSVDGDPAAAYRYTEARLTRVAMTMLEDIDKNTVDFIPNFDERLQEPTVLPAKLPNLIINGAAGIAVGMATNIPPHNLAETVEAITYLVDHPNAGVKDLRKFIKGPDFPTGAIIYGREGIKECYEKGRGRITIRARAVVEEKESTGKHQIVVAEIPYQVNKSNLIAQIAELVNGKKLEGISDLRDESDREGMRIVIELKRDAVPAVVLNQLYKHTQMQTTFGAIMLALVDGAPKEMTLKELLEHFIEHRHTVIVRRTDFELKRAQDREHILEGLKIAVDNIDEVVKIIRKSKD